LDESQEGGAKLVVAGGDATELFELVEEAFDVIALAVESLRPTEALLAPDHVWDVGDGASCFDMGPQPIGIISFVGDDDGVPAETGQKRLGAGQIVGLAGGDQDLDRPALVVDARVDFRREPSAASPHTTISTLFLTPEAC